MALAAALHHSRDVGLVSYNALRIHRTARAGEWGREQNYTSGDPESPHSPAGALQGSSRKSPGGVRPGSVTDPAPQVRVERHVVEHTIEACSFVHILDAPVPQLVDTFRHLDLHVPEQAIEVPKISSSLHRSSRHRVPLVQTAEQLEEVPEFVSFAFLFQQQIVDCSWTSSRSSPWTGLFVGVGADRGHSCSSWSSLSGRSRRSSRCTPSTEFSSVLLSRTC